MATNKLFHITAITNLHVGSGKENIGVVDNLIQRDVVSNLPIIHSSSLKGALREHFCNNYEMENKDAIVKYIFGSEASNTLQSEAGKYRFFDAHILALPVRSDKVPYLMATCPAVIKQYLKTVKLFGITGVDLEFTTPIVFSKDLSGTEIEDLGDNLTTFSNSDFGNKFKEHIGCDAPIVVLSDNDFDTLCDDNHLPVIARNQLNNGESKNLWYEQVLPRFSVLYFPLIADDKNGKDIYSNFKNCIENCLVQIGANASVGYGFCQLTDVTVEETPQPSNK